MTPSSPVNIRLVEVPEGRCDERLDCSSGKLGYATLHPTPLHITTPNCLQLVPVGPQEGKPWAIQRHPPHS